MAGLSQSERSVVVASDLPFNGSMGTTYALGGDALDPNSIPPTGGAAPLPDAVRGINDTIFASNGVSQIFVPQLPNTAQLHPYQQAEMLNKLYNNVTTHSNTFAVFLTIGFFEVVDDTDAAGKARSGNQRRPGDQRPPPAFAIVDRTNLEVFGQPVATTAALDTPNGRLVSL